MIDASLFVPQSRERVFVIGVDADADAYIPADFVADGPSALFHPPALVAACKRQRDATAAPVAAKTFSCTPTAGTLPMLYPAALRLPLAAQIVLAPGRPVK